jgi:hypothetical protein
MDNLSDNWHGQLLDTLKDLGIIIEGESCQLTLKVNGGNFAFVNKATNLDIKSK